MHGPRRDLRLISWAIVVVATFASPLARAGGFEIPDNGTQAVGRGTAFVAKASDGTAIHYNPAGLARQRGTSLVLDGNLYAHSFEFQRLGSYSDDPQDPETPWGAAPYPAVTNIRAPYFSPFAAVTTDFGYFDRLTFAAGVYSSPMIGNRTFPVGVDDKPAPSRYDLIQSRSSLLLPTASAGVRLTRWLDLGISGHLALGRFEQTTVSYADVSAEACKNSEYFRCDAQTTVAAKGTSFGATIGAMLRPSSSLAFGASFRTPITIHAQGTATPAAPKALEGDVHEGEATLALQFPWLAKAGARYIKMDGNFEVYDLELDLTYEAWGVAQGLGPILTIPDLGAFKDIQTSIEHRYRNTYGARAGGEYNIETGDGLVTLRAGAYFDSSATDFAFTRVDHDTLAKVAGTIGVGYKLGSFGFDLGYAAVASLPRVVGSGAGDLRPANLLEKGDPVGADGRLLSAVNEGAYRGFTHLLSIGVSLSIDGLFGPARAVHYGNSYEPNYVGPLNEETAKKVETKKPDKPEERKKAGETNKTAEKKPEEKKPEDDQKGDDKLPEEKKPEDERKPEKKPEKKPDERKPEKLPLPPPPAEEEPPPEVKEPPPPPPKPPTKRKEWWEEVD